MPFGKVVMRVFAASIGLALSLVAVWLRPAAAGVATLCKADEGLTFSCPTGARTISLCSLRIISKSTGSLRYRFGRKGKLDLAYPDLGTKPADVFTSGKMIYSGGGGA